MRLIHTMTRGGELERCINFCTDVLGMRLLRRKDCPKGEFILAFVDFGGVGGHSVTKLTHIRGTGLYDLVGGFGHLAIEVGEVYRACKAIPQRGGKIVRETGPMNAGNTIIAFVADPDGFQIELPSPKQ